MACNFASLPRSLLQHTLVKLFHGIGLELVIPEADAVHPQEALAVLPKFCNTDNDLNNCVAGDLTNGRVRSGRQVARAVASIGRMQVASYEVACSHKLVKYWLAGRKFFRALGTVAISTDQSRVGQKNIFKAFIVGVRDGQTKAMWMIPQAISHVKQKDPHHTYIHIFRCVVCVLYKCMLSIVVCGCFTGFVFSKFMGFHGFYLFGLHGFSWVLVGSHGFSGVLMGFHGFSPVSHSVEMCFSFFSGVSYSCCVCDM